MPLKQLVAITGRKAKMDQDYVRGSTKTFQAWFDMGDDEVYVLNNCGITIGSGHPSDSRQRCLSVEVADITQSANPGDNTAARLWQVDVTYGLWNILERSPDGNPINIPKRVRLDFTSEKVPALIDVDGNPIVNSAGDYYDPPVEYERLHATLTVMRNEAAVNIPTVAALSNTVNLNVWNGFPAKTVRLCPIKLPEIAYSQVTNTFYYPMAYEFEINFDTWVKQVLNQGFRRLDPNGNLVPIYIDGKPIDNPVMLDESGQPILATSAFADSSGDSPPDSSSGGTSSDPPGGGEPPEGGDGTDKPVVINAFDVYRTMDFSASTGGLNMDNLFTLPTLS